jgi:hypothetical protein
MNYKHIFLKGNKVEINPFPFPKLNFNYLEYEHELNKWLLNSKLIEFSNALDLHKTKEAIKIINQTQFVPLNENDLFKEDLDISNLVELEYDGHYENIVAVFKDIGYNLNTVLDNRKEVDCNLYSTKQIEETQEQMLYDIELFIRRENGNNTEMAMNIIREIKNAFTLTRNGTQN